MSEADIKSFNPHFVNATLMAVLLAIWSLDNSIVPYLPESTQLALAGVTLTVKETLGLAAIQEFLALISSTSMQEGLVPSLTQAIGSLDLLPNTLNDSLLEDSN